MSINDGKNNLKVEKTFTIQTKFLTKGFIDRIDGYADYIPTNDKPRWYFEKETLENIFSEDFNDEALTDELKNEFDILMTLMNHNLCDMFCCVGV
jgi:hypothetical protein